MKKTLIALAALAATASFAQSSVTLYGKANLGFQTTNGSKTAMVDAADGSGSRFGLKGTEDLGGGLKASFVLESGLNLTNGENDNTANQQFQRSAWVGLSNANVGEVRFGRQYTVGFDGSIGYMPSTYVDSALAVGLGFNGMGSRSSTMVKYLSPSLGGLKVSASTQLAANTTDASTPVAKNNELGLAYANGPLTANLTAANVTASDGVTKTSPMGVNATYNFGAVSAVVGYVNKDNAAKDKGVVAKVMMPVGAHSMFAGYAKNSTSKVDAYELGDYYTLSKTTSMYVLYGNGNTATAASGKRIAVGVTQNF